MRLIDVDKIDWQKGVFVNPRTDEPLPIIHKIATIEMLRDWQEEVKAIPIPDNSTNGDMIKAIFADFESHLLLNVISKEWWNAPYKKEVEE